MDTERTITERTTLALKKAILQGEFAPGQRLHIHDLAASFGVGVTPVREALSRLASLGLVVAQGQRGFRAAPSSLSDLQDIVRTRTHIETEALRRSIRNGGQSWRRSVQESFAALDSYLSVLPEFFDEGDDQFDRLHKEYHKTLISACGSERMLHYCSVLYDEAYRYRQIFMAQPRTRSVFREEHRSLTEHVLSGVEERGVAYLTLHLDQLLSRLKGSELNPF